MIRTGAPPVIKGEEMIFDGEKSSTILGWRWSHFILSFLDPSWCRIYLINSMVENFQEYSQAKTPNQKKPRLSSPKLKAWLPSALWITNRLMRWSIDHYNTMKQKMAYMAFISCNSRQNGREKHQSWLFWHQVVKMLITFHQWQVFPTLEVGKRPSCRVRGKFPRNQGKQDQLPQRWVLSTPSFSEFFVAIEIMTINNCIVGERIAPIRPIRIILRILMLINMKKYYYHYQYHCHYFD